MPIYASDSAPRYAPPPEETYQAVCVDVVDLGEIESVYAGETRLRHIVKIVWQIALFREDGTLYELSRRFTLSLHEKAALRGFLERWRGKRFSPEELHKFDVERLVTVNGMLQVLHNISPDGRVWANVETVTPLAKGSEKMAPESYVREKDRADQPDESLKGSDPSDEVPF